MYSFSTESDVRALEGLLVAKAVYEIYGHDFTTVEEFFDVVSRVLIPDASWGHNLNAFNDVLRGGFGTPDGGFVLRWVNSALSREHLGCPETVRQLEECLSRCLPLNRKYFSAQVEQRNTQSDHACPAFILL